MTISLSETLQVDRCPRIMAYVIEVEADKYIAMSALERADAINDLVARWHRMIHRGFDKLAAEIERVTSLGATKVRYFDDVSHGFTNTFAVMLDPVGNEFCVCAPHLPVMRACPPGSSPRISPRRRAAPRPATRSSPAGAESMC